MRWLRWLQFVSQSMRRTGPNRSEDAGKLHSSRLPEIPQRSIVFIALATISTVTLGALIWRSGYGADNDTFLMLGTWDILKAEGKYVPSRYQGYPLAEVGVGLGSAVGGHWIAGLISIALGATCLACIYLLAARRLPSRSDAALMTAVLGATPIFVIAATTSSDYVYGLALFLGGWLLFERRSSPLLIGVVLGLATAGRITYAPLGLILLLVHPGPAQFRQRFIASLSLAITTAVAYLPAILSAEDKWALLDADRPTGQGVQGLLARSLLKSTWVLGLVGTCIGIATVIVIVRQSRNRGASALGERWLLALLGIIAVLWFWLPVEPSYLLPGLAIGLVWLAQPILMPAIRPLLVLLLAALVLFGWLDLRLLSYSYVTRYGADSCLSIEAVDATFSPRLERGPLLDYPNLVAQNAACNLRVRQNKRFGD